MNPKISIITVNYNNLDGLQKTVESVKEQTYQKFEYIVIDGGSTDGSAEYIENNKAVFDYWVSETDTGVYHAMNKGIKAANGEYLLFLNSGDHFYDSKALGKAFDYLGFYDFIYCNQQVVGLNKKYTKNYPKRLSFSYFLVDNIPHQATFIKRSLLEEYNGFDEDLMIVSDWKLFLHAICRDNRTYKYLDVNLTTFYLGGMSSLLENKKLMEREKNEILQSNYSLFMNDLEDIKDLRRLVRNLKRSKKIKWLIKLGLINKF
ncbi:glycosyltransferase family 2 protein [Tamlana crocina]